jgi:hypothetical protein
MQKTRRSYEVSGAEADSAWILVRRAPQRKIPRFPFRFIGHFPDLWPSPATPSERVMNRSIHAHPAAVPGSDVDLAQRTCAAVA